jgi:hypothetical protein
VTEVVHSLGSELIWTSIRGPRQKDAGEGGLGIAAENLRIK